MTFLQFVLTMLAIIAVFYAITLGVIYWFIIRVGPPPAKPEKPKFKVIK